MALRGKSGTTGAASSWTNLYAGAASIVAGDLIIVATYQNGGTGTFAVTGPGATFTAGTALIPSVGGTINANQWGINVAIAAAGDAGTPTYSTTSTVGAGAFVQQILVYSGRVNSSIAAAFSNSVTTAASANQVAGTFAYAMTGLTALAGDDIIVVNPIGVGGAGLGQTYATAITGYGNALATNQNAGTANPAMNALDLVNSAGGATGTLTDNVTVTGGTAFNWFIGGFVMSLPSSGGGGSGPPITAKITASIVAPIVKAIS